MTGFVNINKRAGVSSAREVAVIKKLSGQPCGHMGTLDPMASGVLPIAIGNAARLFEYLLEKEKRYVAVFKFGLDSPTLDITGELSYGGRIPEISEVQAVLPSLIGEVMQIPPKYSAKNVGGKRSYQLAREGAEFELQPKKVRINFINLIKSNGDEFTFEISCGGGTYIRSIARDMAETLSTHAVLSSLVRTKSGNFELENSVESSSLTAENLKNYIIPTDSILPFDGIYPQGNYAKRLFNGLSVPSDKADGIYKIYNTDGSFYGLAEVKQSQLKVRTKLC